MIFGALPAFLRREQVPIEAAELATLDREGARGYNYVTARGLRRARERMRSAAITLAFMLFCVVQLGWTGSGLLAFLLVQAAITVFIDALRMGLAQRWVFYSHSREFRAEEMLLVARGVEGSGTLRQAPRQRQQAKLNFFIAVGCTVIGLPLAWFTLARLGLASWDSVFANFFLPLALLVSGIWRIVRGIQGINYAKASTVGTRDVCLDSDDAVDVYALALLLGVLMSLGPQAALAAPFLIAIIRLVHRIYIYRWQRESLQLLGRRVYRLHPDAPKGKSSWDDEAAENEAD